MHFDEYDNTQRTSLVGDKYFLSGDVEKINPIKNFIKENCIEKMDLYKAEETVKQYCIENYGEHFYKKSAGAIAFLIENAYCDVERNETPLYDNDYDDAALW